jgi:predicted outer membrane repeat protein
VTQHESNLYYGNESGAINESFSDMWGEWVDLTNGAGNDTPEARWYLFEDGIYGAGASMRNPSDPHFKWWPNDKDRYFVDPDRYNHPDFYRGTDDWGGVHHNSGVGNKLCYLLTDGDMFRGYIVTGMGIEKTADLFYECQTNQLTSASDYYDLYHALTQAAIILGFSDAERYNVKKSCEAVEICTDPGDATFASINKVDDINDGNSVVPNEKITYTISYTNPVSDPCDPNYLGDINDVVIVDYLPDEVDPNNPFDPNYNLITHTYMWNIGILSPGEPNSVTLTVIVNQLAEPMGTIINICRIEAGYRYNIATEITEVNSWNPGIIYVDEHAGGSNTGMSWKNAYRNLQDAIERAAAGCGNEIWVSAGTYKPAINPIDPNWYATFRLIDGLGLYGGFVGNETLRNQRNWLANQTIISGDIDDDGDGEILDVVTASNVGQTTIIDGFTIIGGYRSGIRCDGSSLTIRNCLITENGTNWYDGGGMCCVNSASPIVTSCIFSDNYAYYGGGMQNTSSNPNLTNCIFSNNTATYCGGGMDNYQSSSVIVANCIFNNNHAGSYGGGISNYSSSPTVVNCTFSKNSANYGGAIYNEDISSPNVTNCILWANQASGSGSEIYNFDQTCEPNFSFCDIQGSWPGQGNINVYPNFFDADANNFHLSPDGSPCIDKGNNTPIGGLPSKDIDGEARVKDGDANGTEIVDMGADEFYWSRADFNPRDQIVNFIDYAIFANAWDSNDSNSNWNPNCNIGTPVNNRIDYNDLAIFCEDWLWQAGWDKPAGFMTMGQGMGGAEAAAIAAAEISLQSVSEQQIEKVEPLEIKQLIDWLEQLCLDEETKKIIDEDTWLKFIESLKEELQSSLTR